MFRYYLTESKDNTLVRDTETNDVFWSNRIWKKSLGNTSEDIEHLNDYKRTECDWVKNKRFDRTEFRKVTANSYMLRSGLQHFRYYPTIPTELINDYYNYELKYLGIKGYKLQFPCIYSPKIDKIEFLPGDFMPISLLTFSKNGCDQAQFEFYFADIIKG